MCAAKSSWSAQPDNLAVSHAITLLISSAAILLYEASQLRKPVSKQKRQAMKRQLSGVLGDVECVRLAIKD